jgi:hypothetical protein
MSNQSMLSMRERWTFVWIPLSTLSPMWLTEPEWSSSSFRFCIRRIPLPLSTFLHHSAVPILLLFSKLFLIYPFSLRPEGCNPLRVCLLRFVVFVVFDQSNAIFPLCRSICFSFALWLRSLPLLKFYPAIWLSEYVLGIGLQTLAVRYLSVWLFPLLITRTIRLFRLQTTVNM